MRMKNPTLNYKVLKASDETILSQGIPHWEKKPSALSYF